MATVRRTVARTVSRHTQVQRALQGHADGIAVHARAFAAAHSDSGEYARSFRVKHGKVDWFALSVDPDAVSKEFGRTGARGRGTSRGVLALTRAANREAD